MSVAGAGTSPPTRGPTLGGDSAERANVDDQRVVTDRRWFLGAVAASSGILAVSFIGANVEALSRLAVLSSRRADVDAPGQLPVRVLVHPRFRGCP